MSVPSPDQVSECECPIVGRSASQSRKKGTRQSRETQERVGRWACEWAEAASTLASAWCSWAGLLWLCASPRYEVLEPRWFARWPRRFPPNSYRQLDIRRLLQSEADGSSAVAGSNHDACLLDREPGPWHGLTVLARRPAKHGAPRHRTYGTSDRRRGYLGPLTRR